VLDGAIASLDGRIAERTAELEDLMELVCTIPGVARRTAEVLIAECGVDMSVFPSSGHLASWAGICPGNNRSGGKSRSGRTRPGSR
jgi:transposase